MGNLIVFGIPFSIIFKDDGSTVNVIDILNIMRDTFASNVQDGEVFDQFREELENTKGHVDGVSFVCKVEFNTMVRLVQTTTGNSNLHTPHEIVEWARDKIVAHLLKHELVNTENMAETSSRQSLEILLKSRISIKHEAA